MEMNNTALVLEGGAMRGIFTAGILDTFLKHELYFPYTIGVSAGAAFGASYISRQIERNLNINVTYTRDPRYMGFGNLFRKGSYFNFDFIFGDIPEHLMPFDYDTFFNSGVNFVTGITNCKSGKCDFFESTEFDAKELKVALTCSSSMPFISKMIPFKNELYLDGGISDSIPIQQANKAGKEKLVIVLTRNKNYQKRDYKFPSLIRMYYRKYPEFAEAIINRPSEYNKSLEQVARLEQEGKAFVIRPEAPVAVGRLERDIDKIKAFYHSACEQMEGNMGELNNWLGAEVQLPKAL